LITGKPLTANAEISASTWSPFSSRTLRLWSPSPSKNALRTQRVMLWYQPARDKSTNWARAIVVRELLMVHTTVRVHSSLINARSVTVSSKMTLFGGLGGIRGMDRLSTADGHAMYVLASSCTFSVPSIVSHHPP
jgi:hypothetical protein